jgi:hypothetical protein
MVPQRVVGIAVGHEDLNDHYELRHDPVLAAPAGKHAARRAHCAPLARAFHDGQHVRGVLIGHGLVRRAVTSRGNSYRWGVSIEGE